jgi:hypothetical protein
VQHILDIAIAELEALRDPGFRRLAVGEGGQA